MRRIWGRAPAGSLGILGFHNLTPTLSQPHTPTSFPRRFQRLCRLLKSRYDVVTVTEGFRRLGTGSAGDRPLVALIFDDGYADVHHTALPILQEEGLTATAFVVVNCLESGQVPWYEDLGRVVFGWPGTDFEFAVGKGVERWTLAADPAARDADFVTIVRRLKSDFTTDLPARLAQLAQETGLPPYDPGRGVMMNVEQARALVAAGVEVGCHSMSHPILPQLADADLKREIVESREHLSAILGQPVTSFCYPNGDNDKRCISLARSAGYECAVSMTCGANLADTVDSHLLKRVPMSENISWVWPYHTVYRVHATLLEEAAGV